MKCIQCGSLTDKTYCSKTCEMVFACLHGGVSIIDVANIQKRWKV